MQSQSLNNSQSDVAVCPGYLAEFPESFRGLTWDPHKVVTQGGEIPTSDLLVKECRVNRRCLQCGKRLPSSATKPRKFCDNNDKCRKAYEYEKNVPKRDAAKLEKLILDTEFEVKWSAWAGTWQGQQVLAERDEEEIRKENRQWVRRLQAARNPSPKKKDNHRQICGGVGTAPLTGSLATTPRKVTHQVDVNDRLGVSGDGRYKQPTNAYPVEEKLTRVIFGEKRDRA